MKQSSHNYRKQHSFRPRTNGNNRRPARKLDARLFIQKAVEEAPVVETPESQSVFTDYNFTEKLQRNIANRGFTKATPIQQQAIPHLLEGRDVIGIANTGTGKTAAFLLPLINKAFLDRNERILIVTPTRELA